jgi:hypothetical protein
MVQQFYDLQKTAEVLGVTPSEVNLLREQRQLYGYRDGANWKFKVEDVEKLLAERIKAKREALAAQAQNEENEDVLLSELELGQSDPGTSGTVIGQAENGAMAHDSDIQLADSDLALAASDFAGSTPAPGGTPIPGGSTPPPGQAKAPSDLDIELALGEDLAVEDSRTTPAADQISLGTGRGSSSLRLSGAEEKLDDDDLVLGGSGSGSDISIGGDSGISLVDPRDSGLALDEPLELGALSDDGLELGEDDMLAISEEAAPATGRSSSSAADDFLLTPLEEETSEEDSESGSQVIALDTEAEEATAVTGGEPSAPMAGTFDEELGGSGIGLAAPAAGIAPAVTIAPRAPQPALAEGMPLAMGVPRETPLGTGWLVGLGACVFLLALGGMMSYDLVRNMWSWNAPFTINSSLMDMVLSFLP